MTTNCTWEGCAATTEAPALDGWIELLDWGGGINDGFYCPAHTAAIIDDAENDAELVFREAIKPIFPICGIRRCF